jgi:hypothetical protein
MSTRVFIVEVDEIDLEQLRAVLPGYAVTEITDWDLRWDFESIRDTHDAETVYLAETDAA